MSGTIYVQHHLPLRGPDRLMETEPDFSTTTEWVIISIRAAEERPPHGGVSHRGQMSHDHVEGEDRVVGYLPGAAFQGLLQGVQGHLRDPFYYYSEHAVLPFARKGHLQSSAFVIISPNMNRKVPISRNLPPILFCRSQWAESSECTNCSCRRKQV